MRRARELFSRLIELPLATVTAMCGKVPLSRPRYCNDCEVYITLADRIRRGAPDQMEMGYNWDPFGKPTTGQAIAASGSYTLGRRCPCSTRHCEALLQ